MKNVHHHMGFDITSERIIAKIAVFVEENITSKPEFEGYTLTYWVTGHSRGGALANLVGAKLIDEGKRVFAYTFAAPAVTDCAADIAHGEKYSSIFNVINTDDFVTYFPLSQWGFTRYGRSTSGVSVSGLCRTEWESRLGVEYKRMSSPEAPLEKFYEAAATRNACYQYLNNVFTGAADVPVESPSIYPSNVEGYYWRETPITVNPDNQFYHEYQMPMFLMKCFAAVAAGKMDAMSFVATNVAPYLENSKWALLSQIVINFNEGLEFIRVDKIRIEHPHMPETYYLLALFIESNQYE